MLTLISSITGLLGFSVSIIWHIRHDKARKYDWPERIARSAFVYLQCALWGTIFSFIVMAHALNLSYMGHK